jgi:hypothetical protein
MLSNSSIIAGTYADLIRFSSSLEFEVKFIMFKGISGML